MFIIIGQGAAGTSAAKALRRYSPLTDILMITNECHTFYNRIKMPDIVAGTSYPEKTIVHDESFFTDLGITCRMGTTVTAIDPENHVVVLESGERLPYEKLLLATGSVPVIPPIPGLNGPDVYSLWTLADAEAIHARGGEGGSAVVIGAGLIGLKTALALLSLGVGVTVVEKLPHIMPRQLDATAADIIAARLLSRGVDLRCGVGVESVIRTGGAVDAVRLDDGGVVPCDFIVAAVGVAPDTGLAKAAGIATRRGIVVDASGRTSAPDVYAAGDAAEITDPATGESWVPAIWPVAVDQGHAAAAAMAGVDRPAPTALAMNSVELADLPLASIGDMTARPGDAVFTARRNDVYCRLVLHGDVPRGVLYVGNIGRVGVIGNLVMRQSPLPACDPTASHFSFGDLLFSGTRRGMSPMECAYENS